MGVKDLHRLGACEAALMIREGAVTSVEVVQACLTRVREVDGQVQAWTFLDPEYALAQARAADEYRMSGQTIGALHGVPVGLKDIIDTADMPTENGSVLHAARTPSRDASVVSLLRRAGAVILGKTVTTEFATRTPGKTRNPHNSGHTPGGSSSGSAAAVAAEMVPLALGSQTTGSTIRPASFCGVYGLKPTHGLIPRHGMFQLSRALDHVRLFARSVAEIAINLRREWETGRAKLSAALRARIEHGHEVRALDYLEALGRVPELNASLTELFEQRYDAILTPAAFGTAPKGLESTGDPAFCALWTLCGVPALSVPLMQGANGLPLGVQLVGARHRDGQLLRTACWLGAHLSSGR